MTEYFSSFEIFYSSFHSRKFSEALNNYAKAGSPDGSRERSIMLQDPKVKKGNISKVSWGETSGLYPTADMTPTQAELNDTDKRDEGKTTELMEARAGIDFIYNKRNDGADTDQIDLNYPSEKKLASFHLKDNFPGVAPEIKNDASVGYFYLSPQKDAKHTGISGKYWDQKVVKSYGPFYNVGGDVKKGAVYIIFYSATPKK